MNMKRWIALGIAAFLLFGSTIVSMTTENIGVSQTQDFVTGLTSPISETVNRPGSAIASGKIAIIYLDGIIDSGSTSIFGAGYNHQSLLDQFDHAAQDPDVQGVIFRVNTPGGGVVESDEIHDKVVMLQEEYGKPVYVSMGSQAASGGYYVAAPSEKIFANAQTITGSLGVIMQSINFSELAEDLGIRDETIKSGEFKDIMSSFRDMTDNEREIMQALIMDAYEQFVDVIDEGRGDLTREEVYELADGRIYTGSQASENGLIDGIGHLDDVIDVLIEDLGRGELTVVEYEENIGFGSLFGMTAETLVKRDTFFGLESLLSNNQGPKLMYLYSN